TTSGDSGWPSVAMDVDGDCTIAWQLHSATGYDLYMRRYTRAGFSDDNDGPVGKTSPGDQRYPSIAMAPSGEGVIVWQHNPPSGNSDIRMARFGPSHFGIDWLVNSDTLFRRVNP